MGEMLLDDSSSFIAVIRRFDGSWISMGYFGLKPFDDLCCLVNLLEGAYSLEGRLEALTEFLSKGVYGSSSFFNNCIVGTYKTTFKWRMEAEAAFQRWKRCMEILPTFTAPADNEALFLHLTTPFDGISAILLAERRKIYIPIYFVSRALQGIEHNYTNIERLILALVNAARRLRKSTRIAKWAIDLEEHDIEYQNEDFADGQTLTNVSSQPGQVSASPKKEFFRAKRKSRLLSSGSKAIIKAADQSSTKSLRSVEGLDAHNLFAPEDSESSAHQNMKTLSNSVPTKPIPLTE
ncbi:reverse transcriptase domain-containing protein [Artemisia annua]|uniref:Reverse transcriptase domain-containing protein n=1 Tax=Artemisia annua TaxID=35608 RepID=A0A2U1KDW8_ARTAN|nr:reverse transcriptase domain-containing protein [Artemisia annua]